jgi:hypothetical protein
MLVGRGVFSIACNFSAQPQMASLRAGKHSLILTSDVEIKIDGDNLNLPPESAAILKLVTG